MQQGNKHHKYSDGGGMFSRLVSGNWRAQQDDQTRVKRRRAACKQVLTLTPLHELNRWISNCFYFPGFTLVWATRLLHPLVFIAVSKYAHRAVRIAPKARPCACTRRKITFFPKKMESITLCHSGPINSSHLSSRSPAPFFSPFN